MFLHWSDEYVNVMGIELFTYIKQLLESVHIDAIIGSHPHVTQQHFYIGKTLIASSLGNLLFPSHYSCARVRCYSTFNPPPLQRGKKRSMNMAFFTTFLNCLFYLRFFMMKISSHRVLLFPSHYHSWMRGEGEMNLNYGGMFILNTFSTSCQENLFEILRDTMVKDIECVI